MIGLAERAPGVVHSRAQFTRRTSSCAKTIDRNSRSGGGLVATKLCSAGAERTCYLCQSNTTSAKRKQGSHSRGSDSGLQQQSSGIWRALPNLGSLADPHRPLAARLL